MWPWMSRTIYNTLLVTQVSPIQCRVGGTSQWSVVQDQGPLGSRLNTLLRRDFSLDLDPSRVVHFTQPAVCGQLSVNSSVKSEGDRLLHLPFLT